MTDFSQFLWGCTLGLFFWFGLVDWLLGHSLILDVVHRIERADPGIAWGLVAGLSALMVALNFWTGVSWSTVVNAFLTGFALQGIFVMKLLHTIRRQHQSHQCEIENLMQIIGEDMSRRIAMEMAGLTEAENFRSMH
jgi:hypothetical protein